MIWEESSQHLLGMVFHEDQSHCQYIDLYLSPVHRLGQQTIGGSKMFQDLVFWFVIFCLSVCFSTDPCMQ